ncbi:MAG: site-specific integrase [Ruminococcus sp.]|nr:site-specific integrase [Ruminococcus sp.]MBS5452948.1 site-specific integrase [Ruminococcus sp.]
MSTKRRDNKGRILRTGESQRKDGRYAYKYTDAYGKPQFVYAWKLVSTDKTPAGKRDDISLREKEKEINKDIYDGIDTIGKKITVCQLYAKHTGLKKNVKRGTEKGRQNLLKLLSDDPIGSKSVADVKPSDAKEWAIRMGEKGYSYQTIKNYQRSLLAAFYTAIEDDYIRKNPFRFAMNTVIEDGRDEKVILTPEQEESLIAFAQSDPIYQKYADEIIILSETGVRISELCGFTTHLDFKNRTIQVDHQLLRDSEIGFYIETPKTKNGVRQIHMSERAYGAFQRVLKRRGKVTTIAVDGYTDFLFLNSRNGLPKTAANYDAMVKGLTRKYNKLHKDQLPNITPHTFRHSFCTRMANSGMNPKALQYIMGHANITMTLDYYAHASFESAKAEMERIEAQKDLSNPIAA